MPPMTREKRTPSEAALQRAKVVEKWVKIINDTLELDATRRIEMRDAREIIPDDIWQDAITLSILQAVVYQLRDAVNPNRRKTTSVVVPLDLRTRSTSNLINEAFNYIGGNERNIERRTERKVEVLENAKLAAASYLLDPDHLDIPTPNLPEGLAKMIPTGSTDIPAEAFIGGSEADQERWIEAFQKSPSAPTTFTFPSPKLSGVSVSFGYKHTPDGKSLNPEVSLIVEKI